MDMLRCMTSDWLPPPLYDIRLVAAATDGHAAAATDGHAAAV
jgi:hypothetical protein